MNLTLTTIGATLVLVSFLFKFPSTESDTPLPASSAFASTEAEVALSLRESRLFTVEALLTLGYSLDTAQDHEKLLIGRSGDRSLLVHFSDDSETATTTIAFNAQTPEAEADIYRLLAHLRLIEIEI